MPVSTSNSRRVWLPLAGAALSLSLLGDPRAASAGDEEGCLGCHGLPGYAVRDGRESRVLGFAEQGFTTSLHGDVGCRECHADISSIPHGERREAGCGQPCHGRSAGGKEYSHERLYWEYAKSSHGSTRSRTIGCLLCHPAPERRGDLGRDKLEESRRCAACHRERAQVRDWFADRHYRALAGGNSRAPSCADCHSAHRVLPAAAPESSVGARHLTETCANGAAGTGSRGACHGGLAAGAVAGSGMNPLPASGRGAARLLGIILSLLSGTLTAAFVVRAGLGLVRGR